jgi:hypothetical protein
MGSIMVTYATVHIDGMLDCTILKVGLLQASFQPIPVTKFYVIAGVQRHPIWAIERLAIVVYCYCQAAKANQAKLCPDEIVGIEMNLSANLVSGTESNCVVASSILWHTSTKIRRTAETMIGELIGSSGRGMHRKSSLVWPFQESMRLPVNRQP